MDNWVKQDELLHFLKPPYLEEVAEYITRVYPNSELEELVKQCQKRILSKDNIHQQLEDIDELIYKLDEMLYDKRMVSKLETIHRHYRSLSIKSILTGISPIDARTLRLNEFIHKTEKTLNI